MATSYKGFTVPEYTDVADGPTAFSSLVDSGPIPRFADNTARDNAIVAPPIGALCYNTAAGDVQMYTATGWVNLHDDLIPMVFSIPGAPEAKVYSHPMGFGRAVTIKDVYTLQGVGPTGADNDYDVLLDGVSIYPTSTKPSVGDGATADTQTRVPDTTAVPATGVLKLECTSAAATPGSDVTVVVWVSVDK